MKASSMILKGDLGSGKTCIREYLIRESKNEVIVKIYGNMLSFYYYFDSFVRNKQENIKAMINYFAIAPIL